MKFYWLVFGFLLSAYIIFSTIWIIVNKTMPPLPKLAATIACGAILVIFSFIVSNYELRKWWKGFIFWPASLGIWAFVVDSFTGLAFHADLFYMSANTWPDKQLLVIVQNGYIYMVFKIIVIIIGVSLVRNFYYKRLR